MKLLTPLWGLENMFWKLGMTQTRAISTVLQHQSWAILNCMSVRTIKGFMDIFWKKFALVPRALKRTDRMLKATTVKGLGFGRIPG